MAAFSETISAARSMPDPAAERTLGVELATREAGMAMMCFSGRNKKAASTGGCWAGGWMRRYVGGNTTSMSAGMTFSEVANCWLTTTVGLNWKAHWTVQRFSYWFWSFTNGTCRGSSA